MKRLIGGIILILFALPGLVSAISQGSTVGIIMSLLFIAGGGTMAYFGIKRVRQSKTGSAPELASRVKRKREKCCGCGNYLTFSNRHWGNYGLLKDEGEICGSCTRKMESIVGVFKFKPCNFTKAEIVDRMGIPGVQPATDTVIDKTDTAEPVRAEKCCVCGSNLKFLTRNWGNEGILKDGGEICIGCTGKMQSIIGMFKYKSVNFTTAEVTDRIRELDKEREEKARQKQNEKIARQSETDAETQKVQDQIQNAKSYSVEYLGGVPGVDPENCTEICATPAGICAFTKEIFSRNMKELFLIEWKRISGIYHSSTTKGSDAAKNALLTAGLVRNSGIAVLGGFLCNGQKTEEHITITCKDDTGYESEILLRSTYQAQEIALYLNAQRAVLYKPEKTPATQGTVENPPVVDSIEQLKKLAELKNTGIITEEEFGMKKAELLARI